MRKIIKTFRFFILKINHRFNFYLVSMKTNELVEYAQSQNVTHATISNGLFIVFNQIAFVLYVSSKNFESSASLIFQYLGSMSSKQFMQESIHKFYFSIYLLEIRTVIVTKTFCDQNASNYFIRRLKYWACHQASCIDMISVIK